MRLEGYLVATPVALARDEEPLPDESWVRRTSPPPQLPQATDGWLHAIHPDTGTEVVFKAGEALPDWVTLPAAP